MRNVADSAMFLFEGKAILCPLDDLEKSDHPHIGEFLAMDSLKMVQGRQLGSRVTCRSDALSTSRSRADQTFADQVFPW